MNLAVLLPFGGSLADLERNGKLSRLVNYYLPQYRLRFETVYVFSYAKENGFPLPEGCVLVANRYNVNRFFYTFLLPALNWKIFCKVSVVRVMQVNGVIPGLLMKIFGKKVAVTYGYDYKEVARSSNNRIGILFYKILENVLLPFCDLIIYSSGAIRESILIRRARSVLIPNGVDMTLFKPSSGKPSIYFRVLVQARLTPEKNLALLINAISGIDKKVSLTIIGNGPLRKELTSLAVKLGVSLKIIDKVPNEQMPQYYRDCDLFVFPSVTEGSPKALIEAASCGCAILASNIPPNREIVGPDGAVFFELDKDDLSEKIRELIINPNKRRRMGLAVNKRAGKSFNINRILKREVDILINL